MTRKRESESIFSARAMPRQFEFVLRGEAPWVVDWIAGALHQEGFSALTEPCSFGDGWALRYATIGDNRKAFWTGLIIEIPFVRQHLSFTAAALIVRREGGNTRVVLTGFESRGGEFTLRMVFARLRDIADALERAAGDALVLANRKGAPVPEFTSKTFREVTEWDRRR